MIWATTQHYADFETQVLEVLNKRQYEPDDIDQITDFLIDMIFTRLGLSKPEIQPFQPESDDNEAEAEVIAE